MNDIHRILQERPDVEVTWRSLPDKSGLPPPGRAVNSLWAAQTVRFCELSPSCPFIPCSQNQQLVSPARRAESFNLGSSRTRTAVLGLGWSPGRV
jgi:hypothetical protein